MLNRVLMPQYDEYGLNFENHYFQKVPAVVVSSFVVVVGAAAVVVVAYLWWSQPAANKHVIANTCYIKTFGLIFKLGLGISNKLRNINSFIQHAIKIEHLLK